MLRTTTRKQQSGISLSLYLLYTHTKTRKMKVVPPVRCSPSSSIPYIYRMREGESVRARSSRHGAHPSFPPPCMQDHRSAMRGIRDAVHNGLLREERERRAYCREPLGDHRSFRCWFVCMCYACARIGWLCCSWRWFGWGTEILSWQRCFENFKCLFRILCSVRAFLSAVVGFEINGGRFFSWFSFNFTYEQFYRNHQTTIMGTKNK